MARGTSIIKRIVKGVTSIGKKKPKTKKVETPKVETPKVKKPMSNLAKGILATTGVGALGVVGAAYGRDRGWWGVPKEEGITNPNYNLPMEGFPQQLPPQQLPSQTTGGVSAPNLSKLYSEKLKATTDALNFAKESSLAQLEKQRQEVAPGYNIQRAGLQTSAAQQARNFAEYMANRGLARSGESAQGRLMQGVALQSGMGSLAAQEQKAYDEIENAKTQVINDYNFQLSQAKTQNQIEKLQAQAEAQLAALSAQQQQTQQYSFGAKDINQFTDAFVDPITKQPYDKQTQINELVRLWNTGQVSPELITRLGTKYNIDYNQIVGGK